jgi:hypothetical protein
MRLKEAAKHGGDHSPTFRQARPQLALPSLGQPSVRLTLELQRNAADSRPKVTVSNLRMVRIRFARCYGPCGRLRCRGGLTCMTCAHLFKKAFAAAAPVWAATR